jgi:hypothetical protein
MAVAVVCCRAQVSQEKVIVAKDNDPTLLMPDVVWE